MKEQVQNKLMQDYQDKKLSENQLDQDKKITYRNL
jgi:hypothetical protein